MSCTALYSKLRRITELGGLTLGDVEKLTDDTVERVLAALLQRVGRPECSKMLAQYENSIAFGLSAFTQDNSPHHSAFLKQAAKDCALILSKNPTYSEVASHMDQLTKIPHVTAVHYAVYRSLLEEYNERLRKQPTPRSQGGQRAGTRRPMDTRKPSLETPSAPPPPKPTRPQRPQPIVPPSPDTWASIQSLIPDDKSSALLSRAVNHLAARCVYLERRVALLEAEAALRQRTLADLSQHCIADGKTEESQRLVEVTRRLSQISGEDDGELFSRIDSDELLSQPRAGTSEGDAPARLPGDMAVVTRLLQAAEEVLPILGESLAHLDGSDEKVIQEASTAIRSMEKPLCDLLAQSLGLDGKVLNALSVYPCRFSRRGGAASPAPQ